ncbi:MAG: universal stress protein [Parasphingopyxis sp.]
MNILLASDLTARGDRPFDRAVTLAGETGGRFALLHVVEPGSKIESAREDEVIEAIRDDLPETGAEIEILIGKGSAPKTISEVAAQRDADLIVTGPARHNSLGDITLGTAVDYVVRRARAPVLVVKKRAHAPYRSMVVATDFSDCSREALIAAAKMFPDAEIELVHAFHPAYGGLVDQDDAREEAGEETLEMMDEFLAKLPDELRERLEIKIGEGELHTVIWQEIEARAADLLVVGTHGRSGLMQAAIGSNAQTMLTWSPVDVLMVRQLK